MLPGRPALVLDMLEPVRTVADRAVLRFVRDEVFSPADFILTPNGTCRLHPQLARRVVDLVHVGQEVTPMLSELAWRVGSGPIGNRRR